MRNHFNFLLFFILLIYRAYSCAFEEKPVHVTNPPDVTIPPAETSPPEDFKIKDLKVSGLEYTDNYFKDRTARQLENDIDLFLKVYVNCDYHSNTIIESRMITIEQFQEILDLLDRAKKAGADIYAQQYFTDSQKEPALTQELNGSNSSAAFNHLNTAKRQAQLSYYTAFKEKCKLKQKKCESFFNYVK